MNKIICPTSVERVEENTVRITAFLIVISIVGSIWFDARLVMGVVVLDYFIRAFTSWSYGPISWLARQASDRMKWRLRFIDKAPKVFAARVGFLFAISGFVLGFIVPMASYFVLMMLCAFAFLESVVNFCMGCLVYTNVVQKITNHVN